MPSARTIMSSANPRQHPPITAFLEVTDLWISGCFEQLCARRVALHYTAFEVNCFGEFICYMEMSADSRVEMSEDLYVCITRTQEFKISDKMSVPNQVKGPGKVKQEYRLSVTLDASVLETSVHEPTLCTKPKRIID
ncbi:hypothetical protein CDAR_120341 [Caerostris darwini]|uniref:Uncharacterized protein n=1 Tax=Caerostris darwini TaxID=1538125 RepID=A0AAV4VF84_9ARAC|nr:hypothetical protein CDAR_120341 [Caerostris darwini]